MRKNNAKTTYYWFSIFALCFLCFQAVSYYIRPNYSGEGPSISTSKGRPDRFSQIGLFYGRSFSYKRLFYTLNVGPGYFSSVKKESVALDPIVEVLPDGSTYTIYPYEPTFNPYNGLGMVFVSDLSFFLSKNSGLGLIIYSNFNSKNNMACISLSYKHCFVNKLNTKN